jgi:hypothetical protein
VPQRNDAFGAGFTSLPGDPHTSAAERSESSNIYDCQRQSYRDSVRTGSGRHRLFRAHSNCPTNENCHPLVNLHSFHPQNSTSPNGRFGAIEIDESAKNRYYYKKYMDNTDHPYVQIGDYDAA